MGLDLVELIMEIEDEFDLEAPDNEVEKIRTVGQLIRCVVKHRNKREGEFEDDRKVAERVRFMISRQLGIPANQLRDDMDLFRNLQRG
jgi:hypothetical protein